MPLTTVTANIASGASLSSPVQVLGDIVAIEIPPEWISASLSAEVSTDGVSYSNLYDASGNEFFRPVVGGAMNAFKPTDIIGGVYYKFRSGTAETPTVQSAVDGIDLVITVSL